MKKDRETKAHNDHMNAALLATDPLRFIALCWPKMCLFDKQQEVLLSVRDNHETFVHAANQMGKTRIAAIIAIWFFASRTPARVVISSSNETQLESVLWSEIRQLISSSAWPLPFVVTHLSIKKRIRVGSTETESADYVLGHVTKTVESFQGHHLPSDKPRVLVIFDEASAIGDEYFEASESWAHRKLVVGNPLSTTNFFYRCCKGGDVDDPAGGDGLFRKVIHIDGRHSPNVQKGLRWQEKGLPGVPQVSIPGLLTYPEYLRREQQWDEVKRTTRLHGHFYEGERALLFPRKWLDVATDKHRWEELQQQTRQAEAIGVDVAAGGRDKTVWTVVDRLGVIEQIEMDTPNTMEIPGRTIRLMDQYNIPASRVAFDAGGGGKQIADRLREQGHYVQIIGFGEGADAKQAYKNRRVEMYDKLREYLNPDRKEGVFALPPDCHQLQHELNVLPLQYDSEGRMFLPFKHHNTAGPHQGPSICQLLGGRSPDRADSLVLAVWALERYRVFGDFSDIVIYQECRDLTPEEIADMPKELRDIYEMDQDPRHGDWEDPDDFDDIIPYGY